MGLLTSGSSTLTDAYFNKYYSPKLLDHAVQLLVMDQFGLGASLPKNTGTKTIRWLRRDVGVRTNVQTAVEGVPVSTFRDVTLTGTDATLSQKVEAIKTSDVLGWTDLVDVMEQGIEAMGEDMALDTDFTITNEVVPNVASGNKRYSGGAADFNSLVALSPAAGALSIQDLNGAQTKLTITRAPMIKGDYVAVMPPQVLYDFRNDAKFVDAGKYGSDKGLFTGEVGMWYGVRIVKHTQPWIEANSNGTENTYSSSGSIYTTLVLGGQQFGVPILSGQSPFSPQVIVCTKADKSDPANQFATAAYKWFYAVKTLKSDWAVALRSKSSFV